MRRGVEGDGDGVGVAGHEVGGLLCTLMLHIESHQPNDPHIHRDSNDPRHIFWVELYHCVIRDAWAKPTALTLARSFMTLP